VTPKAVVGLAAVAVLAVSIGTFAAAQTPDDQPGEAPAAAETIDSSEPPVALRPPVALLKHPDYYAPVGQQIRFDASDSYSPNGQLTSYEWDFNGDGVFDESTEVPVATHTYGEAADWTMRVRITDSAGAASVASAMVHVGIMPRDEFPEAPTNVTAILTSIKDGLGTARVTWESDDSRVYRWGITLNGIPIGMTDGNARSAEVTELRLGEDVQIGVVGFNEASGIGTATTVTLDTSTD
jgi:PKD domain.